jgi:hypothetical protein
METSAATGLMIQLWVLRSSIFNGGLVHMLQAVVNRNSVQHQSTQHSITIVTNSVAKKPFTVSKYCHNLADELNKPAYTWHSSVNDNMPNAPNDCTQCQLYLAVALGITDQLRDAYNMVHACEIANKAEKDIAIRRASGFNELFEAALKKSLNRMPNPSQDGIKRKGEGKTTVWTGGGGA